MKKNKDELDIKLEETLETLNNANKELDKINKKTQKELEKELKKENKKNK